MTNPKFAQATDKGRYYVHPTTGERWPSVTNVLDTAINKPALVPWAAKVTAEHILLERLPYYVKRIRTERDTVLKEAKAQVRYVKDTAADLGSRVHAYAEAHVLGKAVADDPEVEPFAAQLLRFFEECRVDLDRDVEAAEATVINRQFGYAGTGDLWVQLHLDPASLTWTPRKRHLWVVDYKTSATREVTSTYPEHGIQVAAIAAGEKVLLGDGTEIDPPGPIVGTAVLNLRASGYALIPMPADREGAFTAFVAALHTTRYLHGLSGKPTKVDPPAVRPVREKASA